MKLLEGKTALITGASRGIGKAIAHRFALEGADIAITNIADDEDFQSTIKELGGHGVRVKGYVSNAASFEDSQKVAEQIVKDFGRIDVLVNNAGIIKRIPMLEMPVSDFREVIDIDLIAPFLVSKRLVPGMIRKQSGKIINICSMMSEYGRRSVAAYASAKGGLKMLTRNMCVEWAKYNIQVNGIGPGYIATELTGPLREKGNPFNDLVMSRTPAGKWGTPDDVANAALFLASKASDFVNGHILYVDGGILANFGYVKGENDL